MSIKNFSLLGFVKKEIEQDWTAFPEGTIISIPTTEDPILYTQNILKQKFNFYMFKLEEVD